MLCPSVKLCKSCVAHNAFTSVCCTCAHVSQVNASIIVIWLSEHVCDEACTSAGCTVTISMCGTGACKRVAKGVLQCCQVRAAMSLAETGYFAAALLCFCNHERDALSGMMSCYAEHLLANCCVINLYDARVAGSRSASYELCYEFLNVGQAHEH